MTLEDTADRGALVWEGNRDRLHIDSPLARESLLDRDVIASTFSDNEVKVIPDAAVVHIGGISIMDKGAKALEGLVPELVEARKEHPYLLSVGGGARERHAYAICTDLDLPTGALASIGWMNCEQNAVMLYNLLARFKAIEVPHLHFEMLPVYLKEGSIPIVMNMPQYFFWEHVPDTGRIPVHRPDTGAFLMSEVWAMRDCIYVKDVDGLYTDNPKTNSDAERIPEIQVDELISRNLPDLPIERAVLECLSVARDRTSIRIINGLQPGNLLKALAGESVGSIIYK